MAKKLNISEFKTYYYNTTKYERKEQLLESFRYVWCDNIYNGFAGEDISILKKYFTPKNKKAVKIKLQGKGYTPAGIDSLFRCISNWLNANS